MKKLLILILCLSLVGCSTYHAFILPTNYATEVEYVFNQFKKLDLKNTYKLKILTKEEMDNISKSGSPRVESENTIYMDDLYLSFLYAQSGGKFYHIRKRDLACIIAHEICHREYNLPDSPIAVHFEVDKKAIEMLAGFNIDYQNYMGALVRVDNYINTRGGDFALFLRETKFWVGALGFGIIFGESDIMPRITMIHEYYGYKTHKEAMRQVKEDFTRRTDWDFP